MEATGGREGRATEPEGARWHGDMGARGDTRVWSLEYGVWGRLPRRVEEGRGVRPARPRMTGPVIATERHGRERRRVPT